MTNELLKTIVMIAIIYIISYVLTLEYRAYPHEIERYHLLLLLFLTLAIGGIYIQEHFFKLLFLLLLPLTIGMSLYGFVIIDLLNDTCVLCAESSCGHTKVDCDGSCYGWYTFENDKKWILVQYLWYWSIATILIYLLKKIKTS
ncbi:MAG TPA: hypothetical protein EYG73_02560 [Arcobacter sp.]|nr:hypothetical protein [Arcobacter sp.]